MLSECRHLGLPQAQGSLYGVSLQAHRTWSSLGEPAEKNKHPPLGSASHNFIKPGCGGCVFIEWSPRRNRKGGKKPLGCSAEGRFNETQQSKNHLRPTQSPALKKEPSKSFLAAISASALRAPDDSPRKERKVSLGRRGTGIPSGIPGSSIPACFPAGPGCWPTSEVGCEHKTLPLLFAPLPSRPGYHSLIKKLKLTLSSTRSLPGKGFLFQGIAGWFSLLMLSPFLKLYVAPGMLLKMFWLPKFSFQSCCSEKL